MRIYIQKSRITPALLVGGNKNDNTRGRCFDLITRAHFTETNVPSSTFVIALIVLPLPC